MRKGFTCVYPSQRRIVDRFEIFELKKQTEMQNKKSPLTCLNMRKSKKKKTHKFSRARDCDDGIERLNCIFEDSRRVVNWLNHKWSVWSTKRKSIIKFTLTKTHSVRQKLDASRIYMQKVPRRG